MFWRCQFCDFVGNFSCVELAWSHAIPARSARAYELMSRAFNHPLLNSTCPCRSFRTPTASPPVRSLLHSKFLGYVQFAKVWAGAVSFINWYVIGDVWGG